MKVSSMSAPGFAKATSYYIIKGEHSNVNLNANNNPTFIAKIAPALDPKDYLYMVKYEIKGKKKRIDMLRLLPLKQECLEVVQLRKMKNKEFLFHLQKLKMAYMK